VYTIAPSTASPPAFRPAARYRFHRLFFVLALGLAGGTLAQTAAVVSGGGAAVSAGASVGGGGASAGGLGISAPALNAAPSALQGTVPADAMMNAPTGRAADAAAAARSKADLLNSLSDEQVDDPTHARNVLRAPTPLGPSEFQRYVLETTGQNLPLYGYNLFANRLPALSNVPVPADYVVGPGDEIDFKIWGAVDASLPLRVDRNGQISIPRVGTLNVAGVKASQLNSVLRAAIDRVYNNYQLSATLGQLRSIQIYVVGQARRPGAYTVSGLSTLISALFESGGPSATGSMRNIQLKRDGTLISRLDLYRFIAEGDKSADARLLPGDVIVIPSAGPRVALTGAHDAPAIYELADAQEPLGKLLAYGGRTLSLTTPHKLLVERIDASRAKAPRSIEERMLDASGLQSTVRDGDVVTLLKISPEFSNAVTLRGNVAAPLRYAYRAGMRVSDLIPERDALIQADYYQRRNMLVQYESGAKVSVARAASDVKNLLEEINWDYAVIERLDAKEIRSQLIPFNLGKVVRERDAANDLLLQPGDVVTIFGVNDLPVPMDRRTQYVRVAGEVNIPGIYQLQPGETLDQVLRRAGGFATNAYPYGTVFVRESTRRQQQENLDKAVRRLESDINSQSVGLLQNLRESEKADVVQAQLASQRMLLSRLQSLRASGRIALELDAASSAMPSVTLEDGDQITVPNRPSFVGVFGAVTAETGFLHRFNATARDYLERAGLTRDADDAYAVIIRADGTVESNQSLNRGWFSFNANVLDKRLNPGDSVFIPEKLDRRTAYSRFIEGVKDWTTIFYQFGLGAAGIKVLRQ